MKTWGEDVPARRDETAIMHDVLKLIATDSATVTEIRRKCNLNFESTSRIMDKLIKESLAFSEQEDGRRVYKPTDRGSLFLRQLNMLFDFRSKVS